VPSRAPPPSAPRGPSSRWRLQLRRAWPRCATR
jgi:hypothetical protein